VLVQIFFLALFASAAEEIAAAVYDLVAAIKDGDQE